MYTRSDRRFPRDKNCPDGHKLLIHLSDAGDPLEARSSVEMIYGIRVSSTATIEPGWRRWLPGKKKYQYFKTGFTAYIPESVTCK